jgi:hypothetical protein
MAQGSAPASGGRGMTSTAIQLMPVQGYGAGSAVAGVCGDCWPRGRAGRQVSLDQVDFGVHPIQQRELLLVQQVGTASRSRKAPYT